MTNATIEIFRLLQPLKTPYRLSFGTLDAFDTIVVALEVDGRRGLGEATPLPGYSDETVEGVLAALFRFRNFIEAGTPFDEAAMALVADDPMTASALICAKETCADGEVRAFENAVSPSLPLAALCDGASPQEAAERAQALLAMGYSHLKLKVGGGNLDADIALMKSVTDVLENGAAVSIDANQRLSFNDAETLCRAVAGRPVSFLEQPFPPKEWDAFARLAKGSPVPLMLDESIWSEADIDHAAEVGADWVKLKLCKHPGMTANLAMIDRARAHGMNVVYGNGVQGAIGNHLEARVFSQARLESPGEFNGVLKVAEDLFASELSIQDGHLNVGGLRRIDAALSEADRIDHFAFIL